MKRCVILGGGYGGLTLAKALLEHDFPDDISLLLIDRMPFQGLKTEYYALAAGTSADVELRVAYPKDRRLGIMYGEVTALDLDNRLVQLEDQEPVTYDWLVVALGCTDRFHDIPGARRHTVTVQTFNAAREAYMRLGNTRPYGQVTIVGGGLSGVEVASELRESRPDLNIRILDRGPTILSAFPGKLQQFVSEWFHEHEVQMIGHVSLTRLEQGVLYNNDQPLPTDVTVWTAGIQPVEVVQQLALPKDGQGRLLVTADHQLPAHPGVYVVGDCASLPFAPSAQAAQAQAKQVAELLLAGWQGRKPRLSPIKLKGVLGSLGKKSGFGLMGRTPILGYVPRMLKSGVLWKSKHHYG